MILKRLALVQNGKSMICVSPADYSIRILVILVFTESDAS